LQKSSNAIALVESFLGEFKPEGEGTAEPVMAEKSNENIIVKNKEEPVHDSQLSNETSVNDSQISIKLENKIKAVEPDTTDVCAPVNKSANDTKETVEKHVAPVPVVEPPPPSPPPQPVKRKVR